MTHRPTLCIWFHEKEFNKQSFTIQNAIFWDFFGKEKSRLSLMREIGDSASGD